MSNPDMQKAIDRLETVAARLENLAQRAQGSSAGGAGSQAAPGEFCLIQRWLGELLEPPSPSSSPVFKFL